ncbi:hypothetical protein [Streptomyces sp. NPDC002276]
MTTFFDFAGGSAHVDYNASVPTDDLKGRPAHPATAPASGIWGQVRDNIGAVVEAGGTYGHGPHRFPTARASNTGHSWTTSPTSPSRPGDTAAEPRPGPGRGRLRRSRTDS